MVHVTKMENVYAIKDGTDQNVIKKTVTAGHTDTVTIGNVYVIQDGKGLNVSTKSAITLVYTEVNATTVYVIVHLDGKENFVKKNHV